MFRNVCRSNYKRGIQKCKRGQRNLQKSQNMASNWFTDPEKAECVLETSNGHGLQLSNVTLENIVKCQHQYALKPLIGSKSFQSKGGLSHMGENGLSQINDEAKK